jgi:hypothetical protein
LALKKLAISCSGESAYRHWKAVENHNCVGESFGYVLEQSLLDRPQVRSVADEADATSEPRKVMTIESFEELEDSLLGFQTKAFTYDFHRKYFGPRFLKVLGGKNFFIKLSVSQKIFTIKSLRFIFLPSMAKGILMFLLISIGRRAFFVSLII